MARVRILSRKLKRSSRNSCPRCADSSVQERFSGAGSQRLFVHPPAEADSTDASRLPLWTESGGMSCVQMGSHFVRPRIFLQTAIWHWYSTARSNCWYTARSNCCYRVNTSDQQHSFSACACSAKWNADYPCAAMEPYALGFCPSILKCAVSCAVVGRICMTERCVCPAELERSRLSCRLRPTSLSLPATCCPLPAA